jgi:nucleoside-diphosphate-sugar epimerase
MRLLVLGGTLFLGRHVVNAALANGHEVTLFNRGQTNADLFPEVEKLRGDRDSDLSALEGRRWDSVVDVPGRKPRVVWKTAEALAEAVDHYTFVSSISAYAEPLPIGLDETFPTAAFAEGTDEDDIANYGPCKAACERIVERLFPGRSFIPRPGLIVGPHDPTDRFTYWPRRVARGSDVLAPGDPGRPVQVIDGRDLADWIVRMVEAGATGPYNATGPDYPLTMGRMLKACMSASGSDAELVWVADEFLLAEEVGPWMELPLWLAEPEVEGLLAVDLSKALDSGLGFRPLEETIRDTLAWDAERPAEELPEGVGLRPERELQLLERWRARS